MFQVPCPNCGPRNVTEFRFGGEVIAKPAQAEGRGWADYLYSRKNTLGEQTEWWFHRMGCRRWFLARRHTMSNEVLATFWKD